jgi:hypothetical protein
MLEVLSRSSSRTRSPSPCSFCFKEVEGSIYPLFLRMEPMQWMLAVFIKGYLWERDLLNQRLVKTHTLAGHRNVSKAASSY